MTADSAPATAREGLREQIASEVQAYASYYLKYVEGAASWSDVLEVADRILALLSPPSETREIEEASAVDRFRILKIQAMTAALDERDREIERMRKAYADLLAVARRISAKLDHPTAHVHALDADDLRTAITRALTADSAPVTAREPRTEVEHLRAAAQEIERLRAALEGLMPYRAHTQRCAYEMTEICTCGMRQAADSARRALTPTPEDRR